MGRICFSLLAVMSFVIFLLEAAPIENRIEEELSEDFSKVDEDPFLWKKIGVELNELNAYPWAYLALQRAYFLNPDDKEIDTLLKNVEKTLDLREQRIPLNPAASSYFQVVWVLFLGAFFLFTSLWIWTKAAYFYRGIYVLMGCVVILLMYSYVHHLISPVYAVVITPSYLRFGDVYSTSHPLKTGLLVVVKEKSNTEGDYLVETLNKEMGYISGEKIRTIEYLPNRRRS